MERIGAHATGPATVAQQARPTLDAVDSNRSPFIVIVRADDLVEVYRQYPVFRDLRDPEKRRGRCGRCAFRALCGGSRARAYAMTGDYLGEEPCCLYEPEGAAPAVEA